MRSKFSRSKFRGLSFGDLRSEVSRSECSRHPASGLRLTIMTAQIFSLTCKRLVSKSFLFYFTDLKKALGAMSLYEYIISS